MSNIRIRNEEDGVPMTVGDSQKLGEVPISVRKQRDGIPHPHANANANANARRQSQAPTYEAPSEEEDLPAGAFEEFINPNDDEQQGDDEEGGYESPEENAHANADGNAKEEPSMGYNSIEAEKRDILIQLLRLKDKGYTVRPLTMQHSVQELRTELSRIQYGIECKNFSDLGMQVICTTVNLLEAGNEWFDPFGLELEGWGESVYDGRNRFEDPMEELYKMYRHRASMHPLVKIMLTVGGMGAMVHYKKQWAKRTFGGPVQPQPQQQPPQQAQQQQPAGQASMQGPPFQMPPFMQPTRTNDHGAPTGPDFRANENRSAPEQHAILAATPSVDGGSDFLSDQASVSEPRTFDTNKSKKKRRRRRDDPDVLQC